jgi:hypothetical protein
MMFSRPNSYPGAVFIDGFAAGIWRIGLSTRGAIVTVAPFRKISGQERDAISAEGNRLLTSAAPQAAHELRFEDDGPA